MSFRIIRYTDKETIDQYIVELLQEGFVPKIKGDETTFQGIGTLEFDLKTHKMTLILSPDPS